MAVAARWARRWQPFQGRAAPLAWGRRVGRWNCRGGAPLPPPPQPAAAPRPRPHQRGWPRATTLHTHFRCTRLLRQGRLGMAALTMGGAETGEGCGGLVL